MASILPRVFKVATVSIRYGFVVWIADPLRRRMGREIPAKPMRLRAYFEDVGGSFVKLGQLLALQPDIIPPHYCDELFDLMDRIKPFPTQEAREIFHLETGRTVSEVFESFDEEPLATASVAQVHSAVYRDMKVAVKIQRPDAGATLGSDTRIVSLLLRFVRLFRLRRFYWLIDPLEEFIAWSREELDFRNEERYTQRAFENACGERFERVPAVFPELTTRRILVIEFFDGITVLDLMRMREHNEHDELARITKRLGYQADEFCRHIVDNFLSGAFNSGLYHADLHPGNLMVLHDSVVGYIDFGITGVLSSYSRHNLIALTLAYARADIESMHETFLKVCTIGANSDPVALKRGLQRRLGIWYEGDSGDRRLKRSITSVMLDWLRLSRESKIWPQRDVVKYIRCSVAMDGLIKRLNPDFDLGSALSAAARNHLEAGIRRQMFSFDRLFDAFTEAAGLISRGPAVAKELLDQAVARGDLPKGNATEEYELEIAATRPN